MANLSANDEMCSSSIMEWIKFLCKELTTTKSSAGSNLISQNTMCVNTQCIDLSNTVSVNIKHPSRNNIPCSHQCHSLFHSIPFPYHSSSHNMYRTLKIWSIYRRRTLCIFARYKSFSYIWIKTSFYHDCIINRSHYMWM